MDSNICNSYKRIIKQKLSYLFTQHDFRFVSCETFKSGEYCNVTLSSPHAKLWINFEYGFPAIMIGHPQASFDTAFFSTDDTYWFGLGELIAYFDNEPVSRLLTTSPSSPLPNDEMEAAAKSLQEISEDIQSHCDRLLSFFQEACFEEQVAEFNKWRSRRRSEFQKLVNKRSQLK